jgi:hypothetical protein
MQGATKNTLLTYKNVYKTDNSADRQTGTTSRESNDMVDIFWIHNGRRQNENDDDSVSCELWAVRSRFDCEDISFLM